jgi:hypothetical protein
VCGLVRILPYLIAILVLGASGVVEIPLNGAAAVADEYARAQKSYDSNPARKAKALSISAKKP